MPVNAITMPYLLQAFDHIVIPHRAAGLGNVLHAALVSSLNIVAEGEEGIGAQRYTLSCCPAMRAFPPW